MKTYKNEDSIPAYYTDSNLVEKLSEKEGKAQMKISLTQQEINYLAAFDINFLPEKDYSDDEMLDFYEAIRDLEIRFCQDYDNPREDLYFIFGYMADKIMVQIPD